MKRITGLIVLLLLFSVSAIAQSPTLQVLKWKPGEYIKRVPLYCGTEGSYTPRQIGTANDTSVVYVLPEGWHEAWLINKAWQDTSGDDSVDIPTYIQYKLTNEVVTGTRYMGWITGDSSNVTTADTLGGDVKKLTNLPPNASQLRVYWDGVTGNGIETGNRIASWIIFTRAKP